MHKEHPDVRRCILSQLHQTVCWLSLSEVATLATVYGFQISWLTKDTMDPRLHFCLLMCASQYSHVPYSQRHWWTDAACHHHLQSEIIWAMAAVQWVTDESAADSVHVNKCFEKTATSQKTVRCRPPTTQDFKGSCRRLSQAASHPRSGNQTLQVIQAHCVWPNVVSRYSTSRNLILERDKKFWHSLDRVSLTSLLKTFCLSTKFHLLPCKAIHSLVP